MTTYEGPYASVLPYIGETPPWVPEEHADRIRAYLKYDDMYWNVPENLKLMMLEDDNNPIFVPKPRTIVDTTSHYLLKGLTVTAPTTSSGEGKSPMAQALDDFMKREKFFSKFHIAKHSGVTRGDYIIHIYADENKLPGKRVSINSVHPAAYFPVYDDWNPDKLIRVHLAETYERFEEGRLKTYIRKLTYEYIFSNNGRRVVRTEGMFEQKDWFDPEKAEMVKSLLQRTELPEEIDTIPVYVFPNQEWQGGDFGKSELSGFERIFQAIDQTMTDEEMALALEGLGVYATDAAGPIDPDTKLTVPWEIAPGRVMEVPTGAYFKRVEGVGTVTPMLEHVKYLEDSLYEASGTSDIARGIVDVQVAQSGIALALKFLPTLAKIEERDQTGLDILRQFWYDWKSWYRAYEGMDFGDEELSITLGNKLPDDKTAKLNELNNMFDRKIISAQYYRQEAQKLGYEFPEDIVLQIDREEEKKIKRSLEVAQATAAATTPQGDPGAGKSGVAGRPKTPPSFAKQNRSNNRNRPNESGGTEAR